MIEVNEETSDILEKSLSGKRISKEEAYDLMLTDSLFTLGSAANNLRQKKCGDTVTYIVNRNINFTNICQGSCKFCAYRKGVKSKSGFLMTPKEVVKRVVEAAAFGATEVCIQGGLHPDLDMKYYTNILESIKSKCDVHIHAFSPMEVTFMAGKSGLGIKETLKILKEKGLGSMPGTAAEIFDREIRDVICPEKISADEWITVVKTAHNLGIPTTATMLYGHIERPEHRINHLDVLRTIQDETGGFTEFVPLSFIHYNTPLKQMYPEIYGASGLEDLKMYAISRLFLDNFTNIQASWVKLGKKLAQVALSFGANDLGGTIMDENISRAAGQKVDVMDEDEIRAIIAGASRKPVKRDTLYETSL